MKKYYLHCEYEVLLKGKKTVVLLSIECANKERATQLMKDRESIYKNMKVSVVE